MSRKDRPGACESGEMKGGRGDICTREIKASGRPDKTRATLQERERERQVYLLSAMRSHPIVSVGTGGPGRGWNRWRLANRCLPALGPETPSESGAAFTFVYPMDAI